ncbi:MAG: Nramp family divalent metal transporter, partial [Nitrospirae bacterium]|nr:Nramp family divalent metal transporter [Nitrospirota bacterium]
MKRWGRLAQLKPAALPRFPRLWALWGPGLIWMALAQGSGELIWWPYVIAKYGLAFLFLLIPACLLQYPLNYEIGRYTLLTGESIFQGFIRLNRWFALLLWALMTLSFLWFGAFASAGGTALAALTQFPVGWTERGQTLFWAYGTMAVFFAAILFSRVVYRLIEWVMTAVAFVTLIGLILACLHPRVISAIPSFLAGLVVPQRPLPRPWDPADATKLLTAVTFAGLGGFWTLFYSYWLREKGVGMARHMGRVTGPVTGKPEVIPNEGFAPEAAADLAPEIRRWQRYLIMDGGIGVFGNLLTTLMACLLAYAFLYPEGVFPDQYQIAVVQSRFFEASWGVIGQILFLLVAAAFLCDTWLATVDAVSRTQSDFLMSYFPSARKYPYRVWYVGFIGLFTMITAVTMPLDQPGTLIVLSAMIGFIGTVIYSVGLLVLNHRLLPRLVPNAPPPSRRSLAAITVSCVAYSALAIVFLIVKFGL